MKPKKKSKSFALALRLRARAATLLIALLCGVTGAWADNYLYLEVSGTSATLKYGDKGSNPYHIDRGWSSSDFRSTVTTITVDASCNSHSETSFKYLFYGCTKLTTINGLGNLKTAGVTDMSEMFYYDEALTTLDLSTWNTASVTDMSSMFNSCPKLATIYVGGGWSTASVSKSSSMFFGCSKLPNYNSSVVDKTKAHTGDGGYLTAPDPGTAVDLGLPSGKKWADRNVGAASATGYGTYYAWAATASQADYSQANAPYYSGSAYTKYTGSDYTMLQRGDDAATVNWGSNWRMPTDTELQELIDNTTKEWKTNYNETGVNGYLVTSKTNGNSIFLPAAGWYNGTELRSASLGGNYWMSTVVTSNVSCGYSLNFYSTGNPPYKDNTDTRYVGFSIRPVQMFAGEGTEDSPYLIASTTDWDNLVSAVNAGETYSGNYFKMTANVGTVSTWMTGTFSGTFDGDGKTLTVGYSNTTADMKCAPFGTLNGATIQNLKVAGSISSNQRFIAGIAAWCSSTGNNVTNCLVSATINSGFSGNAADGGLVSLVDDGASLNVTGCAFAGKMLTTNGTTSCGGIVGWRRSSGTVTITNCLYAPASATGSETWIASAEGENGNANFCRWNSSEPTITNCYYTTDFGSGSYTAQGLQARSISAGDYVSTLAISGDATATYDVSGITVYSTGISFNDGSTTTFYGGSGQTVSLALTAETRTGYQFTQYAASQGTLSAQTATSATLTMPAANSTANDVVTISAEYDPLYNADFADGNDNTDWDITPTSGTEGTSVTVSYTGENKVKSVTVKKLALCSLSEVTSEHVGKIIGADGNVYASLAQAEKVTSAVGVLGKVTETGHGLIMSLEDAPKQVWATIDGWASASYAGTTLKVLPDDDARGSNLPSYTTLGSTTVSNWAVATRADYTAIFTNLGSTGGDSDGISYDANMNAKITGAGGTAISGDNWSSTQYDSSRAWRFASTWGARGKTDQYKVRPVLGF